MRTLPRAAYPDAACTGRTAQRRRGEELLGLHWEDGMFLTAPVVTQWAAAEESLAFLGPPAAPGSLRRLDHYEVLETVGQRPPCLPSPPVRRRPTGRKSRAKRSRLRRNEAVRLGCHQHKAGLAAHIPVRSGSRAHPSVVQANSEATEPLKSIRRTAQRPGACRSRGCLQ